MEIELIKVTKKFGDNEVIKETNLIFKQGNIYGFTGRNGSGKSVLQKMICGLYKPTTGQIIIDKNDINEKDNYPKNMRILIEKPTFLPELSGYENLKLLAEINNIIGEKEIEEVLELVNLDKEKNKKYSKYSLGMKQKLGIAQALMEDVDIIILDEPFNGIENSTVKKIIEHLKQIKLNKIIIISSHIKEDIDNLCDIVYEFDDGYINEKK